MSDAVKIVVDTQIFLRAAINPESASGRLFSEWNAYYILYVADEIEAEIIDVLNRAEIRTKFPQITDEQVKAAQKALKKAVRVEVKPEQIQKICRDPKDDIFLACAKVAEADYLVSEDKDLLVLERYGDTAIVKIAVFLSVLEKLKSSESD